MLREFHSKIIDLELHTQRPAAEAPPSAAAAAAAVVAVKQEDLPVASSWCTVPKNSLELTAITGRVRAGRARAPLLVQSTTMATTGGREHGKTPKAQGLVNQQCVAHYAPHNHCAPGLGFRV